MPLPHEPLQVPFSRPVEGLAATGLSADLELGGKPDFLKDKEKDGEDKASKGMKKVCPSCKYENKADAHKCKKCNRALIGVKARDLGDPAGGTQYLHLGDEHGATLYDSGLDLAGGFHNGLLWKVLCKTGTLALSPGPGQVDVDQPLVLTDEMFLAVKESYDDRAFEHVTIPETHANGTLENTGQVRALEVLTLDQLMADERIPARSKEVLGQDPEDTLYLLGGLDFTEPDVRGKVERGTVINCSVGLKFNFRRKRDGKTYPVALEHVALTNQPWVDGLPAFGADLSQPTEDTATPWDGVFVAPETESVHLSFTRFDPSKHPRDWKGQFRRSLTGMKRNEVREIGGVKVRKMYQSYNVLDADGNRVAAPQSLRDTVEIAMKQSAASTAPDSIGGPKSTTVAKAAAAHGGAPSGPSSRGSVPTPERDPKSSYGIEKDQWGSGGGSDLHIVNFGYLGLSNRRDVPRWMTGTSLSRADANELWKLRDEVSDAVVTYSEQTRTDKHTGFGKALFGDTESEPRMRLRVVPNGDGTFTVSNYDRETPWSAVVRKGERPQWVKDSDWTDPYANFRRSGRSYGLHMSFDIVFDPKKHPRDMKGRFRETLDKLDIGGTARLPDGTSVTKAEDGFHTKNARGEEMAYAGDDAEGAAERALNISARSVDPKSLGGGKAYDTADQAAAAMESDADGGTDAPKSPLSEYNIPGTRDGRSVERNPIGLEPGDEFVYTDENGQVFDGLVRSGDDGFYAELVSRDGWSVRDSNLEDDINWENIEKYTDSQIGRRGLVDAANEVSDLLVNAVGDASVEPPEVRYPPDENGVHDVGDDVNAAADLLAQDRKVQLATKREASTLLSELATRVQKAKEQGADAPSFNLCQVTVPGTNLFCAESKGIPRVKMPQLGGIPTPGSKADAMPKDAKGEVNLTKQFRQMLEDRGIRISDETQKASFLKASQIELNGAKVAGMTAVLDRGDQLGGDPRLFVSYDDYIVDGHHRWAAHVGHDLADGELGEVEMPVARVDMDIIELLDEANRFALEMGIPQASMAQTNPANERSNDTPEVGERSVDGDFGANLSQTTLPGGSDAGVLPRMPKKSLEQILAEQTARGERLERELRQTRRELGLAQGTIRNQGRDLHAKKVTEKISALEGQLPPAVLVEAEKIYLADYRESGEGLNLSLPAEKEGEEEVHLSATDIVDRLLGALPTMEGGRYGHLKLAIDQADRKQRQELTPQEKADALERETNPERFNADGTRKAVS